MADDVDSLRYETERSFEEMRREISALKTTIPTLSDIEAIRSDIIDLRVRIYELETNPPGGRQHGP